MVGLFRLAAEKGIEVSRVVTEAGSGLNGHRRGLLSVLRSPEYGATIVERRERLALFGSEYVKAALAASGRRLIVMERDEVKDELEQEMIDVLTGFRARLQGRRSARRRAEKAVEAAAGP